MKATTAIIGLIFTVFAPSQASAATVHFNFADDPTPIIKYLKAQIAMLEEQLENAQEGEEVVAEEVATTTEAVIPTSEGKSGDRSWSF